MPLPNLNPCVPSGIIIDLCHVLGVNYVTYSTKSRKANFFDVSSANRCGTAVTGLQLLKKI